MARIAFHTFLSLWLLWISSGIFVYKHYCGDHVQSGSLFAPQACEMDGAQVKALEMLAKRDKSCHAKAEIPCHSEGNPHKEPVKGCCQDERLVIRWNDFQGLSPKVGSLEIIPQMDERILYAALNYQSASVHQHFNNGPQFLKGPPDPPIGSERIPVLGSFLI